MDLLSALAQANYNWLYIVPMLLILVLVHEAGHFFAARWCGVKVEEFGFGLPPRLFGFRYQGVLYSINALPIGGFVRMLGEDASATEEGSFSSKRPWQRAIILVAGAMLNLVVGLTLLVIIMVGHGVPTPTGAAEIGAVEMDSPAAAAGWRPRDVIVAVDGVRLTALDQLSVLLKERAGRPVPVEVQRGSETIQTVVTPRVSPPPGQGVTGIRVGAHIGYTKLPVWQAVPASVEFAARYSWMTVDALARLPAWLIDRSVQVEQVSGPIGMGQLVGEAVTRTAQPIWVTLLYLTAALSLGLFLLNLLPFPALDGGRLVFVLLEWVRGRGIKPEREGLVHFVGLMVLLTLMVVVSLADIGRLLSGRSILP